jgi:CheY-like chemotaxis protein
MVTSETTPPKLDTLGGLGRAILVVDDDEAVRALAKWVIEKVGHPVVTARDGDEALRVFQADPGRFRLVLLDLTMPRMGGLETMQKMRVLKPDQRIVIVTGHGENVLSGDVQEGDVGFLQKPFSPDRLRAMLSKYAPLNDVKT